MISGYPPVNADAQTPPSAPARADGPAEVAQRLEAGYRNLDRAIGFVLNADNKAMIGLAFQGGVVAGAAGVALVAVPAVAVDRPSAGGITLAAAVLLVVFLLSSAVATLSLFHALYPDVRNGPDSPFFFGTIAAKSPEAHGHRMRTLTTAELQEELSVQTHTTASIAARKFRDLKVGFAALMVEFVVLMVAVVVAVLLALAPPPVGGMSG
jgi:hypothetical protein